MAASDRSSASPTSPSGSSLPASSTTFISTYFIGRPTLSSSGESAASIARVMRRLVPAPLSDCPHP